MEVSARKTPSSVTTQLSGWPPLWRVERAPFHEGLINNVLEAAERLGYSLLYMVSGAGHDCSYVNQITAAAMIFVSSKNGRSHVEVEKSASEK